MAHFKKTIQEYIKSLSLQKKIKRKFHHYDTKPFQYHRDVSYVCKIENKTIIEKHFGKLKNEDVIITDERINHIIKKHPNESILLFDNLKITIEKNDAIFCR